MATATFQPLRQIVLHNISWSTYEGILGDVQDRAIHLTYDRGDLEIMSPSDEHERMKRLVGRMIETLTEVRGIPIRSAGSTTFKKQLLKRGLEPDECYYIANEARMRGRDTIDLDRDPPPDLAVEIDITRSSLNRMDIYAALGVPEIWRCEDARIVIHILQDDGTYSKGVASLSFPDLSLAQFNGHLARRNDTDETSWIREFRQRIARLAK
jgi:Uma2 family endonuclease